MSALSEKHQDRLAACWRIQDCGSCLRSKHGCGWCPASSACIPASSILSPLHNAHICPLSSERFELRTSTLGCAVSTTTLLSIIVTILATLLATLLFYGFWRTKILQWGWRIFWQGAGAADGWERVEGEDGVVREGGWRRGGRWNIKVFSGLGDNDASIEERGRLLRN